MLFSIYAQLLIISHGIINNLLVSSTDDVMSEKLRVIDYKNFPFRRQLEKYQFNSKYLISHPSRYFEPKRQTLNSDKIVTATINESPKLHETVISPTRAPGIPVCSDVSVNGVKCVWDKSMSSDISYYAFAIGEVPSGTYSELGSVKWWQVSYGNEISANLKLKSGKSYYVSVEAVSTSALISPIVTSSAIVPIWRNLGLPENVLRVEFAPNGLDKTGATIAGFNNLQIDEMKLFASRIIPIIKDLYGPPADNYTVTVVRDLAYASSNIFLPSLGEIHKDDVFYPQLFAHELIHAFRNKHCLSSDSSLAFDPTLSGFEESFAQGVSYDAMNLFVAKYPDAIIGNPLYGSSLESDYDYQNTVELRGTDFWSDAGGYGIFWKRYEVGAAAVHKIYIENSSFYKLFNNEYYNRINANYTTVYPTRYLIVDIIASVVPSIEGLPAKTWIDRQHIFWCRNVYGNKIFHSLQDYPTYSDYYIIHKMFFTKTMFCGSEWACYNYTSNKWVEYNMNGAHGFGKFINSDGLALWQGSLRILPLATHDSKGYFVFGSAEKSLATASSLAAWPGGNASNYIFNITKFGLYRFDTNFTDPFTGRITSNYFYRVLGSSVRKGFKGVFGGVVGYSKGIVYIDHEKFPNETALNVVNGAFAATRSWTGITASSSGDVTSNWNSVPGKVYIRFIDSLTGFEFQTVRNIQYGDSYGSQMFLINPRVDIASSSSRSPNKTPTISSSSSLPSFKPTMKPSSKPSSKPSYKPSVQSSYILSSKPSIKPSCKPSISSNKPSAKPSVQSSYFPSSKSSIKPSVQSSYFPSSKSSVKPSVQPSCFPSSKSSIKPSCKPSLQPSYIPSSKPSCKPSISSKKPSAKPSVQSSKPSLKPSIVLPKSSTIPTTKLSFVPTKQPSNAPISPTNFPAKIQTNVPSKSQYLSCSTTSYNGTVWFDYSTLNGKCDVGNGNLLFSLSFSKCSNTCIYSYNSYNIKVVARVGLVKSGSLIKLSDYNSTSYYALINTGEIFIAGNNDGYYIQVNVRKVQDNTRGDTTDGILFSYQVNKVKNNYNFFAL